MKVVIVKEQGCDSLVPITLSEEDSVENLRQKWSDATGHDSLDYFFQCCGKFIEDSQLIGELPGLASSSSCVEVIAERSIQLQLRPFGLVGRNLELKVPLSLEVGLLTAALCNALEVSPRPITFHRATDAALKDNALGPILTPKLSLGDQGVSENETLEAVLHVELRVDSRQLMCAGHADLTSLLDPDIPATAQRLRFGDRILPECGELLSVLPEALFSPSPVKLAVEWAVTMRFRVGDSDVFSEVRGWSQQSVWQTFAASSEIASKSPAGSQLVLWLDEVDLDPDKPVGDLPGAAPGGTLLITVDKACQVRVRLSSDRIVFFRVRRGVRVRQLAALVAAEEEDGAFRLAMGDNEALPEEATLRQCNVQSDSLLVVKRPGVDVLFELERRGPAFANVQAQSAFPVLVQKARKALHLSENEQGLLEMLCACGSRVKASDPKCALLPAACCRATPRRLRLVRLVTVRVVRMFLHDEPLLTERFDSTDTAHHVRMALLRRAKEPLAELEWRLCHKGRILADEKALCDLESGSEDLELELEAQMALCVTVGPRCVLWLAWPNSTTESLLAELRTAKHVPSGPHTMLLHGRALDLRREDRWVMLWSNGLRHACEVKVVPETAVSCEEPKEAKTETKEAINYTTLRVICRNWGAPDFETSLPTPVTIEDARQLVASKFQVASKKVFLMQHRAKLPNGDLVIDIGNYRWADTDGTIYKAEECTAFKYNLEKGSERIPIPGPHRWKLFVRFIAD